MTSGLQPPFSGAPTPVSGVTGGPPVLGGQISNDPSSGNVVISPNPGNVLQIRKGNTPQALQTYEYFHTNTDYSRISLNTQVGGPFQLAVETAPSTVIRDLQILANGRVQIPNLQGAYAYETAPSGLSLPNGVAVPINTWNTFQGNQPTVLQAAAAGITIFQPGIYLITLIMLYNVAGTPGARRDITIIRNGTVLGGGNASIQATPLTTLTGATGSLTFISVLAANDLITGSCYQDSGGTISLASATMAIIRIGIV